MVSACMQPRAFPLCHVLSPCMQRPARCHRKVIKRSSKGHRKVIKRSSKGHQEVIKKSSRGHHEVITRSSLGGDLHEEVATVVVEAGLQAWVSRELRHQPHLKLLVVSRDEQMRWRCSECCTDAHYGAHLWARGRAVVSASHALARDAARTLATALTVAADVECAPLAPLPPPPPPPLPPPPPPPPADVAVAALSLVSSAVSSASRVELPFGTCCGEMGRRGERVHAKQGRVELPFWNSLLGNVLWGTCCGELAVGNVLWGTCCGAHVALDGDQGQSRVIKGHQRQSRVIRGNQESSTPAH